MQNKLILFFVFFVAVAISVSAEKDFTIEGKIGDLSAPATAFLFYNDPLTNRQVRDSIVLDNGNFKLKGTLACPVYVRMVYAFNGDINYATAGDERRFYLEPGTITINGRQLFNAEIKGSATQDLLEKYFDMIRPVQKEMIKVRNDIDDIYAPYTREDRLSMDSLFNKLNGQYNQLSMDFIKTHPGSMLAVDMLSSETATHPDNDLVETLYMGLSEEIKNTVPGQRLRQSIQNRVRIRPGNVAPAFTANTLQNKSVSLSEFKGKWLLLVFWSPTCDICHREAQELKQIYAKYQKEGFEILAFAVEDVENKQEWEKAAGELNLPYITVSDLQGWNSSVVKDYKINGIPENYLINPDGLINAVDVYSFDLVDKLENTLKKR